MSSINGKSKMEILDFPSPLFFLNNLSSLSIYFLFNNAELPSLRVIYEFSLKVAIKSKIENCSPSTSTFTSPSKKFIE